MHNLPSKLRADGKEDRDDFVVVVLLDLDECEDCRAFKNALVGLLDLCESKPRTLFRFAIEEIEAWFLGDADALKSAYPKVNPEILDIIIIPLEYSPFLI